MEPAGLCGRCTGVAVPLRVVPSATGLPSKRGPGLGSFSRADRGIGGVRHVAPPTWLVSNQCFISKSFHTPPNNYHVNNYLHLSLDVEIDMFTLHLSSDFTVQTETFC